MLSNKWGRGKRRQKMSEELKAEESRCEKEIER